MDAVDWLVYQNQGATRNQPLNPKLVNAFGFLPEMGLQMEVFSGGQPTAGNGARVGSVRHDHGHAADVFFSQNGKRLDWANPQHQPLFKQVVQRAKANGVTGFGAGQGYMQPGSMHVGFGSPGVWGAGGKGANAADWLREAYGGAAAGPAPQQPAGTTPNGNQLSLGASVPAFNVLGDMYGLVDGPERSMGEPAIIPSAPQDQQMLAQAAEANANQKRREALFADVGSWFA